jgi:YihY family inner membrane protein
MDYLIFFTKIAGYFKKFIMITFRAFKKFFDDQGFLISNGLSFKTIFALIPVMAVFFAFFSVFPSFEEYKEKFINIIVKYIVPTSIDVAILWINNILSNTRTIGVFGTIGLIYVSIDLFISLDIQINQMWGSNIKRPFFYKILIYWAFLTITPIVLVAFFYYSGIIPSILDSLSSITNFKEVFYTVISFMFMESFFLILYYFIPNSKVSFMKALVVSTFVSFTWIILRFIFTYYTKIIVHRWYIYGSVAIIFFFLFWIYVNWYLLLLGIEFLYVWQNKLYNKDVKPNNLFLFDVCFVLMVLKEFSSDFHGNGKGLSVNDVAGRVKYNFNGMEELFLILLNEGILVQKDDTPPLYFLRKDISKISLSDIETIVSRKFFYKNFSGSMNFNEVFKIIEPFYFNRSNNVYLDKIIGEIHRSS